MATYGTIPTSSLGGTNVEYFSREKSRIKSGLATQRSWDQMFKLSSINFHFSGLISRIKSNLNYFRMNYIIIMLFIIFLSLLFHPVSLIVFVAVMAVWLFLYFLRDEPVVIFGIMVGDRTVVIVLSVVTVGLILLTGVVWNVFWSVVIGVSVVVVHAALRSTDDLALVESGEFFASSES